MKVKQTFAIERFTALAIERVAKAKGKSKSAVAQAALDNFFAQLDEVLEKQDTTSDEQFQAFLKRRRRETKKLFRNL